MNVEPKRPRGSHWLIVVVAMLAFAVFSWGVRYKLSLYNPSAHMSAAKLLSQRERPMTSESMKLAAAPVVNPAPITLFALAVSAMLTGMCFVTPVLLMKNVWRQAQIPVQPRQTFFFFRPPPFLFGSR